VWLINLCPILGRVLKDKCYRRLPHPFGANLLLREQAKRARKADSALSGPETVKVRLV